MNRDQLKGAAKDAGGKIEREAGKLTGNKPQQAKGVARQAEGKLQKSVGDIKGAAREAGRKSSHH